MRRFLSFALLWCLCLVANSARAAETGDIIYDGSGIAYSITSLDPAEVKIARQDTNGGLTAGEIVVPSSFTYDGTEYSVVGNVGSAFANSKATLIELPEGMTEITTSLAISASSLETLILPSTIDSLPMRTTATCPALTTIICYATTPPALPVISSVARTPFANSTITTVYVPSESVDTYKASDWASVLTENILPIEDADIIIATDVPFTGEAVDYSAGTNYFYFVIPDDVVYVTISGISVLYSDDDYTTEAATGTDNGDGTYTYTGLTFGSTYYGKLEADEDGSITATCNTVIAVPISEEGEAVDYTAGDNYFSFVVPSDALSVTISGISALYSDMLCTTAAAEGTDNGDGTYIYLDLTDGSTYYGKIDASEAGTVTTKYFAKNTAIYDDNGVRYLVTSLVPAEVSLAVQSSTNGGKTSGDVVIPATVTYDGTEFSVTKLTQNAFEDAAITSVVIEAAGASVGSDLFTNCTSLASATIGEGCSLGMYMFYGCTGLEYIDLPSTVEKIPRQWMYLPNGGSSLETFICRAVTPPDITVYSTSDGIEFKPLPLVKDQCTLYVPEESIEAYEASDWMNYFSLVEPIELALVSSDPEADTDDALEFTKGEDVTFTLTFSDYAKIDADESYINTYKALGENTAPGSIAAAGDTDDDGCSKTWEVTVSAETLSALAGDGTLPLVLYVTSHLGALYNDDGYCMLTYYYTLAGDGDITLTFDPESGSTVTSLSTITVSSGQGNIAYTSDDSEFSVYQDGVETDYLVSTDNDGTAVEALVFEVAYQSWLNPQAITDAGTYTITFPAGTFAVDGTEYDEDVVLTYTISGATGISAINAAIANGAEVYNLAGQRIAAPVQGMVNVVKYADGTVKKVLAK